MGKQAIIAAIAALGASLGWATVTLAEPLDPALSRLVVLPACQTATGGIVDGDAARNRIADQYAAMGLKRRDGLCAPDNRAFMRLINEWGFALAPAGTYSARTTGFGGFQVGMEATYTGIHNDESYWKLGTEGERDAATGAAPRSGSPPSVIQLYGLNIRKNFGLGIEAMANVGFVPKSSIINGGADIRISLLEGFRKGVGGVFPDVAIGSGIRTMSGTDQLQLTTVALDARISKPFVIADAASITPTIGYQYVWIFGRSGLIDMTPGTDPLGYCGFSGQNTPRADGTTSAPFDGQARCQGGSSLDFNNNTVFERANLERQRLIFGLSYRQEMFTGSVQAITDVVAPADSQTSDADKAYLQDCDSNGSCKSVPRQWQLALEFGVFF